MYMYTYTYTYIYIYSLYVCIYIVIYYNTNYFCIPSGSPPSTVSSSWAPPRPWCVPWTQPVAASLRRSSAVPSRRAAPLLATRGEAWRAVVLPTEDSRTYLHVYTCLYYIYIYSCIFYTIFSILNHIMFYLGVFYSIVLYCIVLYHHNVTCLTQ